MVIIQFTSCWLVNIFFFFFLAVPRGLWGLSSPTRDQTRAPLQWKHGVLTTGPPGKSLNILKTGIVSYLTHPSHKSLVEHKPVTGIDAGRKMNHSILCLWGKPPSHFDHSKCDWRLHRYNLHNPITNLKCEQLKKPEHNQSDIIW